MEVVVSEQPRMLGDIFSRKWLGEDGTYVVDGTIVTAMGVADVRRVAQGKLDVTAEAEKKKKREKEHLCKTKKGWGFYAFAMNAFGGFGKVMHEFFTTRFDEKKAEAKAKGEPEWRVNQEKKRLFEDISCEIQRANFAMFIENHVGEVGGALQRMPEPDVDMMEEQQRD